MMLHIVKVLKKLLHVVLKSNKDTGKSAEILCLMLAWKFYHTKTETMEGGTIWQHH